MRITINVDYDESLRIIAGLILSEYEEEHSTPLIAELINIVRKKTSINPKVLMDDVWSKVHEVENML